MWETIYNSFQIFLKISESDGYKLFKILHVDNSE